MTTTTQPTAWQLPASLPEDLAAFAQNVAQYKSGAISPTQFQVFRVPQGVYEQREAGSYMLRVRFPAGVALPHQLHRLAEVAAKFGNGILHVTTRQDIQIHRVAVDSIHPALVSLAEAGLSTKGGGGNTVRNITGCPRAGVCAQEVFDVTPSVLALTEFLLNDPQSFLMPRKYKIAFSGCGRDCSGAMVNDAGFIARVRDGINGFAVYAGGGMGSLSRVAELLEEFVPIEETPLVAEAIKRVFNAHGNRKDKRQARLRYLIKQMGLEAFRKLYQAQLEQLRLLKPARPIERRVPLSEPAPDKPAESLAGPGRFNQWMMAHVKPQKQSGFFLVEIPLVLGDIASDTLHQLADVVKLYGENLVRSTPQQNLVLRWVRAGELEPLHQALSALGLAEGTAPVLRNLIACTGASTCKLGICLSRGVAREITSQLTRSGIGLHALGDLQINVSGCPNACGRHPVANIGLHGAARRLNGRLVPHYVMQFDGHVEEGGARLASGHHAIPARNVPGLLVELLSVFLRSPQRPDFQAFWRESGTSTINQLADKYKSVPTFAEDKNYYFDWGAEEPFSLAGRGPGECGAGVFDLMEVDIKSAGEALLEKQCFTASALAARALLVTRGEQANSDKDAFELFQRHFLQTGLVDARYAPLISQGLDASLSANPSAAFYATEAETASFVEAVRNLFKSMDATLQFPRNCQTVSLPPPPDKPVAGAASLVDLEKDFRGVVCPLNYVKTRMTLERLKPGQTLAVLLDAQGARNVPESAAKDGHEILSITPQGRDSRVIIRKKKE